MVMVGGGGPVGLEYKTQWPCVNLQLINYSNKFYFVTYSDNIML